MQISSASQAGKFCGYGRSYVTSYLQQSLLTYLSHAISKALILSPTMSCVLMKSIAVGWMVWGAIKGFVIFVANGVGVLWKISMQLWIMLFNWVASGPVGNECLGATGKLCKNQMLGTSLLGLPSACLVLLTSWSKTFCLCWVGPLLVFFCLPATAALLLVLGMLVSFVWGQLAWTRIWSWLIYLLHHFWQLDPWNLDDGVHNFSVFVMFCDCDHPFFSLWSLFCSYCDVNWKPSFFKSGIEQTWSWTNPIVAVWWQFCVAC